MTTPKNQHQFISVKSRAFFLSRRAEHHNANHTPSLSATCKISCHQQDIGLPKTRNYRPGCQRFCQRAGLIYECRFLAPPPPILWSRILKWCYKFAFRGRTPNVSFRSNCWVLVPTLVRLRLYWQLKCSHSFGTTRITLVPISFYCIKLHKNSW